jgi:polyhydroxyalkanoate synthesis regulator phasin
VIYFRLFSFIWLIRRYRREAQRDETRELIDRLVAQGDEECAALSGLMHDEVEKAIGAMNLATQADIDALGQKLDALVRKGKTD